MDVWYTTREDVKSALSVADTARANSLVDNKIAAATRSVEGLLHRRFYPERKTVTFDWPNRSGAPTWTLELGDNELISVETLTAGGTVISSSDYFLRRADDKDEAPYTSIEIDLSSSAAFQSGDTFQRAISVLGVFGHNDTDTSIASGALAANINDAQNIITLEPSDGVLSIGVGSLILCGSERMIVRDRRWADTTINLTGALTAQQSAVTAAVGDGTAFVEGESILVDSEVMRIDRIAGNNLTVTRAYDGSVLDDHSIGADVYASRSFLVARHAVGTSAAAHSDGDAVYAHNFPALINELTNAEAVVMLEQSASGYARTVGSGSNARESAGKGLEDLRAQAYTRYGRKLRSAAV